MTYAQEQLRHLEYANPEDIEDLISVDARPVISLNVACDQCGSLMTKQEIDGVYMCPRCSRVTIV